MHREKHRLYSKRLCVSTFAKNIDSLKTKVREARRLNADLIEMRLDFIRNLDLKKLDELGGFLLGNEILTMRSIAEGGRLQVSDTRRVELISYAITRLAPGYFDIEIKTLRRFRGIIENSLNKSDTKLIVSYHDLQGEKSEAYLRRIAGLVPENTKSIYAIKIVSKARSIEDNLKALSLYSDFRNRALVSFCTGDLGIPSRILCLYLGSPYSYASLPDEAVAPGQLDISIMKKILGKRGR